MKVACYSILLLLFSVLLSADGLEQVDKDALSKYRRLIQSADVSERKEAVEALRNVTTKKKKAVAYLLSLLSVEREDEVRDAAYEVLKRFGDDDDAVELIVKALNKIESADVRAQLVKVLWSFKRSDADDAVLKRLRDPAWEVRLTVAELIGRSKAADRTVVFRKRIIEEFIKAIAIEPDKRVRNYIRGALYELTNQDFGTDKKAWMRWWEKHRARYGIPRKKEEKTVGKGKIRTEVVPWEEEETPSKPRPRFFGAEIAKKRVFFVIDVSGSMAEAASDGTKLDVVKKEMKKAIEAMDKTYKFNMLFYNHGFRMWKQELQRATKQIKEEAKAEIDRQMPMGMTNIWASLKKAMEDGDTKLIILLSDGLPTAGITDTNKILEDVRKWNKYRKIQINTVGMQGADFDFLRKLAEQNGGVFRQAN